MLVAQYKLNCSQGKVSHWVVIPAEDVTVSIDLCLDSYQFVADCPECGAHIVNKRTAFKQ